MCYDFLTVNQRLAHNEYRRNKRKYHVGMDKWLYRRIAIQRIVAGDESSGFRV